MTARKGSRHPFIHLLDEEPQGVLLKTLIRWRRETGKPLYDLSAIGNPEPPRERSTMVDPEGGFPVECWNAPPQR